MDATPSSICPLPHVPSRRAAGTVARKLAWWSVAAVGVIVTDTTLLLGMLYTFSVLE